MARFREPYEVGEEVLIFSIDGDTVRARTERVESISRLGAGDEFEVRAGGRTHLVDAIGEGSYLTRIDDFIRHELNTKGQNFEVVREDQLVQQLPEPRQEQERGPGHER